MKKIAVLALLLLVMLAGTWIISRAIYPTAEQRQAIADLERRPAYAGNNAFALLWTLDRAVPDDELEAVMQADVRSFSRQPQVWSTDSFDSNSSESDASLSAAEAYADLSPNAEDSALFCRSRQAGCLQRVRADLERYTDLVGRHEQLLDRIETLQSYDYLHSEFPYSIYAPIPGYRDVFLLRTRHAVQFASGQEQAALAATCREMVTWRRLGTRSDNLIGRLIGDAVSSRENGMLLAEMLAELPVDEPPPEVCVAALAPPAAIDLSLCNAMRGEFGSSWDASLQDTSSETDSPLDRLLGHLTFDREATVGMSAEGFQFLCEGFANTDPEHMEDSTLSPRQQSLWRLDCVGNLWGCAGQSLVGPAYRDYQERVLDHAARLRTLGTLAWMRENAGQGRSPAELLASRPDELNDAGDDMAFGPEGKTLRITLRDTWQGETHWSVPLPPALHRMGS